MKVCPNEYEHLRSYSLHRLSEKEWISYQRFRTQHYKSCHNGSTFYCKLTATGIGEGVEVICPICGATQDITDTESW